jgi:hypothetical protein
MRYTGATAQTTTKCEGCGRRLSPTDLYFPTPQHAEDLAQGTNFYYTFQGVSAHAVVTGVLNTVCSPACDVRVRGPKMRATQAALDRNQAARQTAALPTPVKRPRRASLKYRRRIQTAVAYGEG